MLEALAHAVAPCRDVEPYSLTLETMEKYMESMVDLLPRRGTVLRWLWLLLRVLLVGALWASGVATAALWFWGERSVGGDIVVILCGAALTLHVLCRVWPARTVRS